MSPWMTSRAFPLYGLWNLNALSEASCLVEVVILTTELGAGDAVGPEPAWTSRAIFMQGHAPYLYMGPLKMSCSSPRNRPTTCAGNQLGSRPGMS